MGSIKKFRWMDFSATEKTHSVPESIPHCLFLELWIMLTQGLAPFVGLVTKSGCRISMWLLRAETALNSSRQTTHKYLWFICFLLVNTSSKVILWVEAVEGSGGGGGGSSDDEEEEDWFSNGSPDGASSPSSKGPPHCGLKWYGIDAFNL